MHIALYTRPVLVTISLGRVYCLGPAFMKGSFAAVHSLLLWFVFSLAERKNEPQINGQYHAAAGSKAIEGDTAHISLH